MNREIEIGNRIRELREKAGLTQGELGLALGLNKSTIQRYESGKIARIKLPVLEAMAEKLNVNPEYLALKTDDPKTNLKSLKMVDLFCGSGLLAEATTSELFNTGEPTNREQRRKAEKMRQEENKTSYGNLQVMPNDNVYMIPVFESVSAGFGAYACSDVTEYFPMYIENPADAADMLCIKVKGDSMYPKIEEGDIVAVRKQSSVDSGSLAVMLIDGEEGVVKKVNYGPDWIELISINPMYPPRRFEGAEVQRLQVVGLVKKVIKNV